jgi:hypothetical protein
MEKNNTQTPNTQTDTRENPPYYKIDHKLAVTIWTVLFEEGYEYLEKDLSRAMIEQGLQEIESEDAVLILSFWREYLEDNNLATIIPDDRLH